MGPNQGNQECFHCTGYSRQLYMHSRFPLFRVYGLRCGYRVLEDSLLSNVSRKCEPVLVILSLTYSIISSNNNNGLLIEKQPL